MYWVERFKVILIQRARFVAQNSTNTISWEPILNEDHFELKENFGFFQPAPYFHIQGTNEDRNCWDWSSDEQEWCSILLMCHLRCLFLPPKGSDFVPSLWIGCHVCLFLCLTKSLSKRSLVRVELLQKEKSWKVRRAGESRVWCVGLQRA